MTAHHVSLPAALVTEVCKTLTSLLGYSSTHHELRALLLRINDAIEDDSPPPCALCDTVESAANDAMIFELPRVPERSTASAIEAHVARIMMDMPPPVSVAVIVGIERVAVFDCWAPPMRGDVIEYGAACKRAKVKHREYPTPDTVVLYCERTHDESGAF